MRELLIGLFLSSTMVLAQPAQEQGQLGQQQTGQQAETGALDCDAMAAKIEQHRTAMREMDEKLRAALSRMESATGDAKLEATAEVTRLLAEQRLQVHDQIMSMNDERSRHMMGHMRQGTMSECPMMQDTP